MLVKYILLYQPLMWVILVQTNLKNILAQNIQIVLKEQMLKQRQMLQQVFLNLLKLLWESILERIMKINIEEMAKMVGIDMIQNLLFLYMMIMVKWKGIIYFIPLC